MSELDIIVDEPTPPLEKDELVVVTWNINSIRARVDLFAKMVRKVKPDIVLLQETRCADGNFPSKTMVSRGFKHIALNGRNGHHGVAVLSKVPIRDIRADMIGGVDQPRHVSAVVDFGEPIRLHSLYIPAGGDEPDPEINPKFKDKLAFVDGMVSWGAEAVGETSLLTGDFNIAPYEHDVWSHRQLLGVVSHTPAETERLEAVRTSQGWVDIVRRDRPMDEKVYTWWSYRNKTWPGNNRGRRLDHIWGSPTIADRVTTEILTEARGWEKASDHVPLIARIKRAG
ncbi:exodeoxyribonuclease III [Acuticoccus sp. M5D2P5]|uniref:exodeoxyribonuclease III n=1 Tax=Acuticoccus kalidii TaxID=2910977 RepID=UPI001F2593A8|nr:exodeoxyribonuclease III [Acuticoccus kalidii]MCF3933797.1 exodeoxyribonuclease III [Acuticoccus kalidii]